MRFSASAAGQPVWTLTGDADGRWPLLLTSPHSGRHYPPALLAASRLPLAQLRRAEDAFVDALLDGIAGVPVLAATHARSWLDLNRRADELDPAMFDAPLAVPVVTTERVAAGLGVIPRLAGHGLDIYARALPAAEAAARLTRLHAPWHAEVNRILAAAGASHGAALLIDCHSMPSPSGPRPPQIVLGDCHGTSAHPAIVQAIEDHFGRAGWRVARNAPYAGGYTTRHHGQPGAGIHAVQIEIDRALYLDGHRLALHAGASKVRAAMTGLVQQLVADWPRLIGQPHSGQPWAEAAE
ncbi:N-formylglutamate amidohydrolase [Sandarakinorhabdus sp. AAP62]|uniref:N-formylglutamate amidohydrolase n=1 Tax=Sandarakinorhabdus sp. AAP62 TaxID=1248916 RepID=UPI0003645903|nr:N-formylglutamate amidohydrolase [Sandarakinorhabdus sp. AAP62]